MKKLILFLCMYISLLSYSYEYSGEWKKASYTTKGTWTIVSKEDGVYVILDKNFKTKKGPDLFILLSPMNFEEITDDNANINAYKVAKLDKYKGKLEFKIEDENFDIVKYKSILIHCIDYSHLWAGSNINKE